MERVLVLYATHEGQTQRIAGHMAAAVRAHGLLANVVNAAHVPGGFSLDAYSAAIVAASVHCGRHEKEIVRFVKDYVKELERIPTAFLSVSLSEAGAEDDMAPPEKRARSVADATRMIDEFLAETGWRPSSIKAVAGALLYTKYNFLLRFVMKRISRQAGGATDTSKDHEYTDWAALDKLVDEFVQHVGRRDISGTRQSVKSSEFVEAG
jgi:menaquinone-dependent protoporphyrinogen oxidase